MNKYIIFGSPRIEKEEINSVISTLKSSWIGTGPKTKLFEKKFSQFKKVKSSCAVNSCTAALHLSLASLNLKKNDEVIVPAMTFCSTVNSVIISGAKPVLADVNLSTMNICPEEIKKKITKKTKAVIVVHFTGNPCDMDEIRRIVGKKIKIIEDCAHAIEGKFRGKPLGTIGDFGCFSFYATKNLTTSEGGMVICKNKKYEKFIRQMSLHGLSADAWKRYSSSKVKKYYVNQLGFKYNMTDISASLGLIQLNKINKFQNLRKKIWLNYNLSFKDLPLKIPSKTQKNYLHSHHLYTLIIDKKISGISRDEFISKLHKKKIGTGIHYLCIADHPFYKNKFKWKSKNYPNSKYIGDNIVSLPLSAKLSTKQVKYIIRTVRNVFFKQ